MASSNYNGHYEDGDDKEEDDEDYGQGTGPLSKCTTIKDQRKSRIVPLLKIKEKVDPTKCSLSLS